MGKRASAILVVLLKPGTTLGELVDLAETLKFHRIVEDTKLEMASPGIAKAKPRSAGDVRRRASK